MAGGDEDINQNEDRKGGTGGGDNTTPYVQRSPEQAITETGTTEPQLESGEKIILIESWTADTKLGSEISTDEFQGSNIMREWSAIDKRPLPSTSRRIYCQPGTYVPPYFLHSHKDECDSSSDEEDHRRREQQKKDTEKNRRVKRQWTRFWRLMRMYDREMKRKIKEKKEEKGKRKQKVNEREEDEEKDEEKMWILTPRIYLEDNDCLYIKPRTKAYFTKDKALRIQNLKIITAAKRDVRLINKRFKSIMKDLLTLHRTAMIDTFVTKECTPYYMTDEDIYRFVSSALTVPGTIGAPRPSIRLIEGPYYINRINTVIVETWNEEGFHLVPVHPMILEPETRCRIIFIDDMYINDFAQFIRKYSSKKC